MTLLDFMLDKCWTKEDAMVRFKGYWMEERLENLNAEITNFEVFCDYPFYELNQIYNEFYSKDNTIGSLYDWLEQKATDEIVKKYLRKYGD